MAVGRINGVAVFRRDKKSDGNNEVTVGRGSTVHVTFKTLKIYLGLKG